jgi:hypothetical protein
MWRKRKFVIIALVVASVILAGSIAGVALAQTGSTGDGNGSRTTLMSRVAAILGIDQQKLEDAFAQAQSEMQDEALDSWLKSLVDEGKITQEQADQYKQWWQSRPDMPAEIGLPGNGGFPGMRGFGGGIPPGPPAANQGTSE